MYTDLSTSRQGTRPPALMKYHMLSDLLEVCESLPELEAVLTEMEIAEMEYGDLWEAYSAPLAKKHYGRRMILANQLLKAAA